MRLSGTDAEVPSAGSRAALQFLAPASQTLLAAAADAERAVAWRLVHPVLLQGPTDGVRTCSACSSRCKQATSPVHLSTAPFAGVAWLDMDTLRLQRLPSTSMRCTRVHAIQHR